MVTRTDIENEAEWWEHLIELAHPTGIDHTPTPWQIEDRVGVRTETAITLGADGYQIRAADNQLLALFVRREDRDLALYFANSHAAIIGLIRHIAGAFDFIEMGAGTDPGLKEFARKEADLCRIYAGLFARLGTPDTIPDPQGNA